MITAHRLEDAQRDGDGQGQCIRRPDQQDIPRQILADQGSH
jgi:hypothetical protein